MVPLLLGLFPNLELSAMQKTSQFFKDVRGLQLLTSPLGLSFSTFIDILMAPEKYPIVNGILTYLCTIWVPQLSSDLILSLHSWQGTAAFSELNNPTIKL